jgi:dienelactone hydrolase
VQLKLTSLIAIALVVPALAAGEPLIRLEFEGADDEGVRIVGDANRVTGRFGGAIEFTNHLQRVELPLAREFDSIKAITVGGWFFPRRSGEQYFFFRGLPRTAPQGERMFRPQERWVNFVLGTDRRGFLLGTIHGNGTMPFPHVTIDEVPINAWSQIVVVKDARGYQKFYRNGVMVHSDGGSSHAPMMRPFVDTADGEPVRLAMPMGGLVGEVWIYPRELTPDEIRRDFEQKREKYSPAVAPTSVTLRTMNAHYAAGLWKKPITREHWPAERRRILDGAWKVFGRMPEEKVPLEPQVLAEEDCGSYVRRKVSIQVQEKDRMPAYLLVPKKLEGRVPAIVCFYGTTSGAGKETTVGLSGARPGSPPERNRAFAIDMVEAGFVALAPDYLRDGERVKPGKRPYDTTDFYEQFPDWSIHGKDAWDTSRAIDYLQTLDFVDGEKIGMVGHSYGGHSTIFTAALDERIKAAFANGPVSDFRHHGMHWAVPKGSGNSQSLPAMRPFVLDHTLPIPVTFYEFTSLIAPRPLMVGQAAGERRPMEEENYAAVKQVYESLGVPERVKYVWYAGDHDFPEPVRKAAVEWFKRWLK